MVLKTNIWSKMATADCS